MHISRRQALQGVAGALLLQPFANALAQRDGLRATASGAAADNFRFVYNNPVYRAEFRDFLVNVFHLYPEDELHQLLAELSSKLDSDEGIYRQAQSSLDDLKPVLGDLTYALPALRKQKAEMAKQTRNLLATDMRLEGYLEIGSTGRYLDALEEELDITGERYLVAAQAPSMSPVDILDRGQLCAAGTYIDLADYRTAFDARIPSGSLSLVTVYIGFHHCPVDLRGDFFAGIRAAMKPGAALIVRDHNVHDEKMLHVVALAHDVFNMGTRESWAFNEAELRNFYSLQTLDAMLTAAGFARSGAELYQQGDPTLNALMLYRKV